MSKIQKAGRDAIEEALNASFETPLLSPNLVSAPLIGRAISTASAYRATFRPKGWHRFHCRNDGRRIVSKPIRRQL